MALTSHMVNGELNSASNWTTPVNQINAKKKDPAPTELYSYSVPVGQISNVIKWPMKHQAPALGKQRAFTLRSQSDGVLQEINN